MTRRTGIAVTAAALIVAVLVPAAGAQDQADRERALPEQVQDLRLSSPETRSGIDADALQRARIRPETERAVVRLAAPSVAERGDRGADARAAKREIRAQQAGVVGRLAAADPNAQLLAESQVVLNAVVVEADPDDLAELAADPAVASVTPVRDYQMALDETVPYIGATAVHELGYDGSGIRVAVLDSGVDYTHAALGGSGDPDDYADNDPTVIEPGTFPTAKVVGGFDFVGGDWVGGVGTPPEAPDPDPLDDGPAAGHGTHVADIIGGQLGVAPAASIYAVKVCSSISTACSGIALIQGMEFAVDPDGDGDPSDHVDIINMSLGQDYGPYFPDDLSFAVDNATAVGVLTVAAAGNGSDKPYVTGTPAAAPSALSVAQTHVPSSVLPFIEATAPDSIVGSYSAVFQPWAAPLVERIEGPLQYGDGAGGNLDGCEPFAAGSLEGLVVLVDRGTCNFTLKISNIGQAGGSAGIIGLIAPGDPFEGGDGGDRPIDIPGFMISQADSDTLKSGLPDTMVVIDPASGIPQVGSMVGGSARGPDVSGNAIKPEIGAPGASVSAIAGSGTVTGPFGGTSGATPMVSGSAALLLQADPGLSPLELKARLMNNGDIDMLNDVTTGDLAPITRIGGGEVRVDSALAAPALAWVDRTLSSALSFGFVDVAEDTLTMQRRVRVHNDTNSAITYQVSTGFRFADDEASGAVSISAPPSVRMRPGADATFVVTLTIDGAALSGNHLSSGGDGASGDTLTADEFDGYVVLDDGSHPIHLPWQVLPRKASAVTPPTNPAFRGGGEAVVRLDNTGVGTAQNDPYSLIATSPNIPSGGRGELTPVPDIRAVGVNTFPVPAGFCLDDPSFVWAFAVNTWERQSHLAPVSNQVWLDIDQDGTDDYVVLNRDVTFSDLADGRQLAWSLNLATGEADAFFFAEHAMNTGNTVLLVCAEQVGLTGADMLTTNVDATVVAQDFMFGGPGDEVGGITVTPLGERFVGETADIAGNSSGSLVVTDFGPFPGNSRELGVLLLTNGDRGEGNHGGATQRTEALVIRAR